MEETPVRDVHQMLAGFPRGKCSEDKSEHGSNSPPSVCSKPPYENECVETSAEAKFRSKGASRRKGREGGGGRRGRFGAHGELCMKWKFVRCAEQICACRGNVNNNKWGNLSICFCLFTPRT